MIMTIGNECKPATYIDGYYWMKSVIIKMAKYLKVGDFLISLNTDRESNLVSPFLKQIIIIVMIPISYIKNVRLTNTYLFIM